MTDTSMSAILRFLQCQRSYEYSYVRGLKVKTMPWKPDFGTLVHEGLANIYRQNGHLPTLYPEAAHWRMRQVSEHGIPDKETGITRLLNLDPQQTQTAHDVVDYYWQEQGCKDRFAEIVSVESPRYLPIAGFQIRGTFDLVVKEFDQVVVYDWKTVGSVKDAGEFLLDFQSWFYELLAYRVWGRPVKFVHGYIRREVPPGFGSRPVRLKKNGEPAANNASTNPDDYLMRDPHTRSVAELESFERELTDILEAMRTERFLRNPDKRECPRCLYYQVCAAELSGHTPIDSILREQYNVLGNAPSVVS